MGVAVYPRLGELLAAHRMSVAELERQIEQRFGLSVDAKTLYRLTHREPVQRADVEIVGAAAAILGVGIGDLFEVLAIPLAGDAETPDDDLSPEQSRRLGELFDAQSRHGLMPEERREMEALVAEYGRRRHEASVRAHAARRGIPPEQARQEVEAGLKEASQWWQRVEADPNWRRAVAAAARRHRRRGVVAVE